MSDKKNGFWHALKTILVPAAIGALHPIAKGAINHIIDANVMKQVNSITQAIEQSLASSQRRSIIYLAITVFLFITNLLISLFTSWHISLWLYYATFIPFALGIVQFFISYFKLVRSTNGDKINSYAIAFNHHSSYSYSTIKKMMNFDVQHLSARYLYNPLSITCTGFALTAIDQIYQQEKVIQLAHKVGHTLALVDSKPDLEQHIMRDNQAKIAQTVAFLVKFSLFFILIFMANFILKFYLSLNEQPLAALPPLIINSLLIIYAIIMTAKAYRQPHHYPASPYLLFHLIAGSIRFLKTR